MNNISSLASSLLEECALSSDGWAGLAFPTGYVYFSADKLLSLSSSDLEDLLSALISLLGQPICADGASDTLSSIH